MRPLTITLPPEVFTEIQAGRKKFVAHRHNPRIDKYFKAKYPEAAKINGEIFKISAILEMPMEWRIYIAPPCKHPPARLYAWSGRDALGAFTAVVCCLCGAVLHC